VATDPAVGHAVDHTVGHEIRLLHAQHPSLPHLRALVLAVEPTVLEHVLAGPATRFEVGGILLDLSEGLLAVQRPQLLEVEFHPSYPYPVALLDLALLVLGDHLPH